MAFTITMPQLGETVTEGTILSWVKEIGEYVAEDDILVEISTDKVDTEVPSPTSGVLTEILVPAGTTVDVGTPLAVLSDDGEGQPSQDEGESELGGSQITDHRSQSEENIVSRQQEEADANTERRGVLSPVVRKLAAENSVDLAMVPGTGDGGRITRKDVETFIASGDRKSVV
jgi:pyruvate/2-oxoglutarate dehydrogenase complex dihydrolipoamide acyltransferase (E2) component